MKSLMIGIAVLLAITILLPLAHLAFIEIGREVVILRSPGADGSWQETRLWIVDDDRGASWVHSGGLAWKQRFEGEPLVEVVRGGEVLRFRAHAVPGPHPQIHQLLREKYGLADRWVRFISPDNDQTLAVRLEPLTP